jgi:hypothetical protein
MSAPLAPATERVEDEEEVILDEYIAEQRARFAEMPDAESPGAEDLLCQAEGLSEEDAEIAAAAERHERDEHMKAERRMGLAEGVANRVSKGTRRLYEPYQECWNVRLRSLDSKDCFYYNVNINIDISPHAAFLQRPQQPGH